MIRFFMEKRARRNRQSLAQAGAVKREPEEPQQGLTENFRDNSNAISGFSPMPR
jgi:hypothetical protein